MHQRKPGAHRSNIRSTVKGHTGSHRDTASGRYHLDWTWRGVWVWALAYWHVTQRRAKLLAETGKTAAHNGPLYRVGQVLRTSRFWDALVAAPLPEGRWAPPIAVSIAPSWNQDTRTSILATPWGAQ